MCIGKETYIGFICWSFVDDVIGDGDTDDAVSSFGGIYVVGLDGDWIYDVD